MNRNTSNKSQQADLTPGKEVPQMGQKPWHGKLFAEKHPKSDKWFLKRELKQTYNRERYKRGGETNLFQCMLDPGLTYSSFCGKERGKCFISKYAWSRILLLFVLWTSERVDMILFPSMLDPGWLHYAIKIPKPKNSSIRGCGNSSRIISCRTFKNGAKVCQKSKTSTL